MQLTRRELIDLAKQLKHKGGVGPKYIKLSKSEDDSVYKILAQDEKLVLQINYKNQNKAVAMKAAALFYVQK